MDAAIPGEAQLRHSETTRALLLRLWREHVSHYRGRLLVVLVLTAIMAGTTSIYPVVIDHAFQMFTARDSRILYQLPVLVVAVTSVKAAAQYFQTVLVQQVVLRVIRELQERMFAHLARADLARLEREAPAQLAARFTTDAATIREALTRAVNGLADAITVVGLVASMLYLDWLLSLIAAALYPLAAVPIQRIGQRVRRASGGMQERMGDTAAILNESFAQARTVRAYRLEAFETARADAAFLQLYRALLRMSKSRARIDPFLEVLGGAAVAAVIGFEGWRAAIGTHGLGNFTGFVAALLIASRPLRALGSLNAALQEELAGLARVFQVMDEEPDIRDAPGAIMLPPGPGRVVFEDVYFCYPDGREALRGLSFRAVPGMTLALVGPSGGGKSTALALIPRLHDATAGAVEIDGHDVREVTLASLRDAIAYVGQDALLFDDTVEANIRMGREDATQEEVRAAAMAAAADDFITALPSGTELGSDQAGSGCPADSGSVWCSRAPCCAIHASCFWMKPQAPWTRRMRRLCSGRLHIFGAAAPQIVVAHRLSTVRDADLVVVMADGRAVEQGRHADLLAHDGVYARLVRSQALAQ